MTVDTKTSGGATAADPVAAETAYWTSGRRTLVLVLLCLVGMISFIDRQIITALLQPIKEEFGASDTQMGILTGTVFAAFYVAAGIPIARLADLKSRKLVLVLCLAFWSLMTSLGGVVTGFWMLAATRVGVAVGEAGAGPTSHSILMDLYPVHRRAVVLGFLVAMQAIGIGIGIFLGGWLSQAFGWRAAFLIVGVPGVLLAGVLLVWLREPTRGLAEAVRVRSTEAPSLAKGLPILLRTPSYAFGLAATGFVGIGGYGMLSWAPTFMMRVHHMSGADVGKWIGFSTSIAFFVGIMLMSAVADWLARRDLRAYLWIAAIGPMLTIPAGLWFLWEVDSMRAVAAYFAMTFASAGIVPLLYVVSQTVAPLRMRAMSSMIMALVNTVAGVGIGPVVIGMLNDHMQAQHGELAIRYSLSIVIFGWVGATVCAIAASFYIRGDYARLQREIASAAAADEA